MKNFKLNNNMKLILEYVWLDGRLHLRSKYKTIDWQLPRDFTLQDVPTWNYDGSSTFQANTDQSEIILSPVALYKNPFFQNRAEPSFLVMCDTYTQINNAHVPTPSNHNGFSVIKVNLSRGLALNKSTV